MKKLKNSLHQIPPSTSRSFHPQSPLGGVGHAPSQSGYNSTPNMAPTDRDMPFTEAWAQTPRQYRPTRHFEPLYQTSLSNINSDAPSPTSVDPTASSNRRRTTYTNFPTSLSRIDLAPPPITAEPADPHNRRRTTSHLPRLDLHHGNPTVARSHLTASASASDLSQPSPRTRRRFTQLRRFTPTRIPSPKFDMLNSDGTVARSNLTASAAASDPSQTSPVTKRRFPPLRRSTPTRIPRSPTAVARGVGAPRSSLRASQTFNDLGKSLEKDEGEKEFEPDCGQGSISTGFATSKIPSPTFDTKEHIRERRYVSTPVLPSQKKENVAPKTLRLLGPISPSRNQPTRFIPKSRTMGMLSSFTSSFSKSSLSLQSRYASSASLRTADATTQVTNVNPPPEPEFTTNVHQVYSPKPDSYWAGRFSGLHDRFHNEMREASLANPLAFRQLASAVRSPNTSKSKERSKGKGKGKVMEEDRSRSTPPELITMSNFIEGDEEQRCKRVFVHLEALCMNDSAKKSLWDFQLRYARTHDREGLLPVGGKMEPKVGVFKKMGRAVEGASTSFGRRSGMSAFGKKKQEKEK